MQENLLDEDGTEVSFVFCDNCNPSWEQNNSAALPDEWADSLEVERGTHVLRGTLRGSPEEALEAGWEEREFGHMCIVCLYEEKTLLEQGDSSPLSIEEALTLLTEGPKKE